MKLCTDNFLGFQGELQHLGIESKALIYSIYPKKESHL